MIANILLKIVPATNIAQMAASTVLTQFASAAKILHLRTRTISKRAKKKRVSIWGSVSLIVGLTRLVKTHASNFSKQNMECALVK